MGFGGDAFWKGVEGHIENPEIVCDGVHGTHEHLQQELREGGGRVSAMKRAAAAAAAAASSSSSSSSCPHRERPGMPHARVEVKHSIFAPIRPPAVDVNRDGPHVTLYGAPSAKMRAQKFAREKAHRFKLAREKPRPVRGRPREMTSDLQMRIRK